jgi:hypothetical protein
MDGVHQSEPSWGNDPGTIVVNLRNAVRQIEERDERATEWLLAGFLCAAWPSQFAQDQ